MSTALSGALSPDNALVIPLRMTAVALVLPVLIATAGCGLLSTAASGSRITMTSESMKPTIEMGEHLTVRRTADDYVPRLGEVIAFIPDGWSGITPNAMHVSRVIGVPGSTVACCDSQGRLQVNGKALDEPYVAALPASQLQFSVQVPPGRLWVMSDNRHIALDSRAHRADPGQGTIAVSDVSGVVSPPSQ
ncbi:signal peptidase I [Nonomuraea angiospora]|uniref:signal peptidase I n=1 Tax=Nonomuraea angiospora TaxID=46172 RepID=UPI00342BDFDE